VNTFIRLMPVIFACIATQAFAYDPTTPTSIEPAKSATTTAAPANPTPPMNAAPAASATNPAPAPAQPQRLVLEDKTLTSTEVNRLLSQGYKPQKGRGDMVLYCRSESQLGTHFEKKVCLSADQLKTRAQDNRDITDSLEHNFGQPVITPGTGNGGSGPK
jgi:hypothetical protein